MKRLPLFLITLCIMSTLVACGDNGATGTGANSDAPTPEVVATEDTTDGETNAEGVPDACTVLTADEIDQISGVAVGVGSPTTVVAERSICIFDTGLILAVEVGENWETSRMLIEDQGRVTEDIAGLGAAAFFDPAGQVLALGDLYFVGITGGGDVEVQKQLAAAMLDALGEG